VHRGVLITSSRGNSMASPCTSCAPLALLYFLLLSTVFGCSSRGDTSAPKEKPRPATARNDDQKYAGEETQMPKQPKHGFQEYVKNPDFFREESRETVRANSARPPTQQELAGLVSVIGKRRLEPEELQQLRQAGEEAAPLLQAALRDEKFLLHRYSDNVLDGSAIETALDLLEPFALPPTSLLEPALRHPDEFFRYHALYHLARCGNDDAVEALVTGLRSPSEQCRTWTLMGLEFLKDSPRGSSRFRAALFEASLPLLADQEYDPAEHAPRALLALDLRRARSVLLGENVFRPDNKYINKVLQALKDANVPVSAPPLRKLLAGIKTKAEDYPFDRAYAEGLILLARAEGSQARELIGDAQGWGNKNVKDGAAEALAIAAGVNDAYGFVIDLYQRKGAKGLTEPQLHYLTLSWLDAEVKNGGFSQYYFNSSGELATYAVKSARSVGASEIAVIVEKANALFGKNGPHPDRNRRMDQLSKIDLKVLRELDTYFYKCPECLTEILPRFVASNPEAFKPSK
jgi:HEAT repeat protein